MGGPRLEELEQSLHEKDSIIDKLSRELQRAGESIDAMSVKLQGIENHPQNHLADIELRLREQEDRIRAKNAETELLEKTITSLQKEATANAAKKFDEKLLERLENENDLL